MGSLKHELGLAFQSFSTASTIATAVALSPFVGVLTGWWLDNRFFEGRTYPWLTLLCFFFGLAGGVKNFKIMTDRFNKEAKRDERRGEDQHGGETRPGNAEDDSKR